MIKENTPTAPRASRTSEVKMIVISLIIMFSFPYLDKTLADNAKARNAQIALEESERYIDFGIKHNLITIQLTKKTRRTLRERPFEHSIKILEQAVRSPACMKASCVDMDKMRILGIKE